MSDRITKALQIDSGKDAIFVDALESGSFEICVTDGYDGHQLILTSQQAQALSDWLSPRDVWNHDMAQAPRHREILIATRSYVGGVVQAVWLDEAKQFVDLKGDEYHDAYAWQPLPEPPGDE